jgi:hypothetical protein
MKTDNVYLKNDLREAIKFMIEDSRKSGVPDDGLAEILVMWMIAHIENKIKIQK